MPDFFIDFHCHPAMKPFGKSFEGDVTGLNDSNRRRKNSIWFYDSPNLLERAIQLFREWMRGVSLNCTSK